MGWTAWASAAAFADARGPGALWRDRLGVRALVVNARPAGRCRRPRRGARRLHRLRARQRREDRGEVWRNGYGAFLAGPDRAPGVVRRAERLAADPRSRRAFR